MSHVGGATFRTTPISRSALEMNLMPGHLFEGNPVGEGTKRRGTDSPMHLLETPAGSTHSSTRGLRPPERLERQAEFPSSDKMRLDFPVPTLQGPAIRVRSATMEVRRGTLRVLPPLEMRPSSIAPNPVESREGPPNSRVSLTSQRHTEKLPEATALVEGTQGLLP